MKEDILQFIWRTGLFDQYALKTTCGKELIILSPGIQNFNAGPDFFNAKVRIGKTLWAGNVEVHLRSSDWGKHGHHLDAAYNNVILHVVMDQDSQAFNTLGRVIHTLQLRDPTPLLSFYRALQAEESWLPCHSHIHRISTVRLKHWLTLLQGERLEQKSRYVSGLLFRRRFNWEETLCLVLASAFGLPINSLPFEMTLTGIPHELLVQNRDSLNNLEAILFGQAGFLDREQLSGPYDLELCRRYSVFAEKIQGESVEQHLWKFLRLRPASFPTLRISQFAALLHTGLPLLDTILDVKSVPETEQVLRVESSTYWDTHYVFGKCSPESRKVMGHQSILSLIINGLVPFLFSYGRTMNHEPAIMLGNKLLQETGAESNQIIKKWAAFGIVPEGAFESQALIQLHNVYCKQKRCLDCQIGAGFIQQALHEIGEPGGEPIL
ncbi:MAG: DUF2851 family protein [Bacteroidetes bacterium]|nr:DUF2851 family protein [Bacteroidota bacterium]